VILKDDNEDDKDRAMSKDWKKWVSASNRANPAKQTPDSKGDFRDPPEQQSEVKRST